MDVEPKDKMDREERAVLQSYIDATMPQFQESRERETALPMIAKRKLRCEEVNWLATTSCSYKSIYKSIPIYFLFDPIY